MLYLKNLKKTIYLSHVISQDTPSYGNKDSLVININSSIQNGDTANTSSWFFSNNHFGTHLDSPYHFCELGVKTYEIPPDNFVFNKIQLVDIPCNEAKLIGISELESSTTVLKDIELLLIRTGYEKYRQESRYLFDNPGIHPELAAHLRKNYTKLRCIGFDFISLTSWKFKSEGRQSHKAFLCPGSPLKPILVVEDMSLKFIEKIIN